MAVGSDAGAYQVLHGQGVQDESRAFDILGDTQAVRSWMEDGEKGSVPSSVTGLRI